MTLILGVNLLDKLYLISDTRVTTNPGEADESYDDDLSKYFYFNKQCSCVAAGKTLAASYFLCRLNALLLPNDGIDKLEYLIKSEGKQIISDYVNTTGKHNGQVALIIGGFNPGKIGKSFTAARIGNALSGELVEAGDGSAGQQSVDNRITEAILTQINKGRFEKDDRAEVKTHNSRIISVVVDIQTNKFKVKNVECYDYTTFYPNKHGTISIKLPDSLLSYLEFRRRDDPFSDKVLYEDCQKLMSFVNNQAITNGLPTVGGHIFPVLQTIAGSFFPTGDLATIKNGEVVNTGSFFVNEDGQLAYTYVDGRNGVFRQLKKITDIVGDSSM